MPGVVDLHEIDHHAADGEQVPRVTQPQAELGLDLFAAVASAGAFAVAALAPRPSLEAVMPPPHPPVTQEAADLLADERADDDADVLQADLLRVEPEFLDEQLACFHGHHDVCPEKDHAVGAGGDDDARARGEGQRLDEVIEPEGGGVDAAEGQEGEGEGFGGRLGDRGGGRGGAPKVEGFAAEEEVEEELHAVGLDGLLERLGTGAGLRGSGRLVWLTMAMIQ